jgi:carboxypeptidase PM20D1
MSYVLIASISVLIAIIAVVLIRTLRFHPPVFSPGVPVDPGKVPDAALARLAQAITYRTISIKHYAETDFVPYDAFIGFLKAAFPLFHSTCECSRINGYALMYLWKGSDRSLNPLMLTAHYDVVPVEAGTESDWKYPPFSGEIAEGRVWGRGTLDIKSQIIAQIEAATVLMQSGYAPKRDIYFVYGQDEEVGGEQGALKVAEYFASQHIMLECVLDEGGIVLQGMLSGVDNPIALIGIAEKGFTNYVISVAGEGGHSSTPPKHTALGELSSLIARIEAHPLPKRLTPEVANFLRGISGDMNFKVRMAISNLWLFKPLLLHILSKDPTTNALVRTTFAATMANAGSAHNVLPRRAEFNLNVRLLHGDTSAQVEDYIRKLAGNLPIHIETNQVAEASQVTPASGKVYDTLTGLIGELYPGIVTAPYVMLGGTDSRKYYNVCSNVYRFTPIQITNAENSTMHNTNESITIDNYARMISFYEKFIKKFC